MYNLNNFIQILTSNHLYLFQAGQSSLEYMIVTDCKAMFTNEKARPLESLFAISGHNYKYCFVEQLKNFSRWERFGLFPDVCNGFVFALARVYRLTMATP